MIKIRYFEKEKIDWKALNKIVDEDIAKETKDFLEEQK